MTNDDRLFGYRLQLFALAGEIGVRPACRQMGVHHSTYYRWKALVERHGLEVLRPRERRAPKMPNQTPAMVEERILAFSLGHAGFGPKRVAARLARPEWGGLKVSPNGVWKVLRRHGLSTRQARLALIAGYRAPHEPPRQEQPEPRVESARPGELVGFDCFFVGRLRDTKGAIWQLTACDTYSSYGWTELVTCKGRNPTAAQTSALVRRVARELQAAGWRLERALTDNGNEFRAPPFHRTLERLGATRTTIRAGRPQTNGHVERLHRTILEECWRPAFARYLHLRFTGLREELDVYMDDYNHRRDHHGRNTRGRPPADLVYGARKMEARSSVGRSRSPFRLVAGL